MCKDNTGCPRDGPRHRKIQHISSWNSSMIQDNQSSCKQAGGDQLKIKKGRTHNSSSLN